MSGYEIEDLFGGETSFTDFEKAAAQQIAIAAGRREPNKADMELAVKKTREWNNKRVLLGLSLWV
jgi:hypothetical protein